MSMKQVKRRKHQYKHIKLGNSISSDQQSTMERTAMDVLMAISNQVQPQEIDQKFMKTQQIQDTKKMNKPRKFSYQQKYKKQLDLLVQKTKQAKRSISAGPKQHETLKYKKQSAINFQTFNPQENHHFFDNYLFRSTFLHCLTPSQQMIRQKNISHSLIFYKKIRPISNCFHSHKCMAFPNPNTSLKLMKKSQSYQQPKSISNKKLSQTVLRKQPLQLSNKQSCSMFRQKNKYSIMKIQFPLSSKNKAKKIFFQ